MSSYHYSGRAIDLTSSPRKAQKWAIAWAKYNEWEKHREHRNAMVALVSEPGVLGNWLVAMETHERWQDALTMLRHATSEPPQDLDHIHLVLPTREVKHPEP